MEKELGAEAKMMAEMINGKIKLSVKYDGKQVDAELAIYSGVDELVDALGALIPGDSAFEKGGLELLKAALKTVTV